MRLMPCNQLPSAWENQHNFYLFLAHLAMMVEGIEGVREGLPTTWAEVLFGENLSSDARISKISGKIIDKLYPNP